jgi:hypothetical protein
VSYRPLLLTAILATYPLFVASAQSDFELDWFAFAQLTAEHEDGSGGIAFGNDRVRFNVEGTANRWSARAQLDIGTDDLGDRKPGSMPNVIQDLYATYRATESHALRFGQFKTPLGMDFNVSGSALDITKRGMEAGLVLHRDVGVMVSGQRVVGGFSYDAGVFNPAGRSSATQHNADQVGEDNVVAFRGRYDHANWHGEIAFGESPNAGGANTADYRVTDLALRYSGSGWDTKIEWIEGRDVRGSAGRDERVYYVHGGYALSRKLELVARYYDGRSTLGGPSTRLTNTYLGVTAKVIEHERLTGRLQINYVIAGGDEAAYTGVRGYRDDAALIQLQLFLDD